jgi:hypothetical protein
MPTAQQCRAYAAEYQRLGQEADISIQRALGIWNWLEDRVPKKRTSTSLLPVSFELDGRQAGPDKKSNPDGF